MELVQIYLKTLNKLAVIGNFPSWIRIHADSDPQPCVWLTCWSSVLISSTWSMKTSSGLLLSACSSSLDNQQHFQVTSYLRNAYVQSGDCIFHKKVYVASSLFWDQIVFFWIKWRDANAKISYIKKSYVKKV